MTSAGARVLVISVIASPMSNCPPGPQLFSPPPTKVEARKAEHEWGDGRGPCAGGCSPSLSPDSARSGLVFLREEQIGGGRRLPAAPVHKQRQARTTG